MTLCPAPNVAEIAPSDVMMMLSAVPAADPFWLFDEVAEGAVNPVSEPTWLASTMSQVIVAACAPFAHTGAVNVTSASGPGTAAPPPVDGAVGVTDAM